MNIHFVLYPLLLALIAFLLFWRKASIENTKADVFTLFLSGAKESRLQWFRTLNARRKNVDALFLGDSLIQEWPVAEMFPKVRTANRGIGGITSEGVLEQFKEIVLPLQPRRLVLLVGTNDFTETAYQNETTAQNIVKIITTMKKAFPKTRCHILSIPPVGKKTSPEVDPETVGPRDNDKIKTLNKKIRALVGHEATFHDIHPLLADANGFLKDEHTREGLHLTPEAYEKLTEYLEEAIFKEGL